MLARDSQQWMLDYLIQNYLIPEFPEAKVGQPFELAHNIDHLDVKPDAILTSPWLRAAPILCRKPWPSAAPDTSRR